MTTTAAWKGITGLRGAAGAGLRSPCSASGRAGPSRLRDMHTTAAQRDAASKLRYVPHKSERRSSIALGFFAGGLTAVVGALTYRFAFDAEEQKNDSIRPPAPKPGIPASSAAAATGAAATSSTATLDSSAGDVHYLRRSSSSARTEPDISQLDSAVLEDASASMRTRMETYVKLLQHRIVKQLGAEETETNFYVDQWLRKEGGEGISCVLQDGQTFEKAGVNISIVHGMLPPRAIAQMSADHTGLLDRVGYQLGLGGEKAEVQGLPFYATGLSLVVHPKNPMAPTVHFNYRYFELTHPPKLGDGSDNPRYDSAHPEKPVAWWFGGGSDLTPIQLFDSDATHFHNTIKQAADMHDRHFYPVWKAWCDRYFWIPHRGEARGVGGIFFDDLTIEDGTANALPEPVPLAPGSVKPVRGPNDPHLSPADLPTKSALPHTRESLFATVRALGDSFLPAYLPILQVRKRMAYTPDDMAWQAIRRGRYVEFNLVYDRGTKFGLQTPGARIESILMSLPLKASWIYGHPYSGKDRPTAEGRKEAEAQGAGSEYEQLRIMDVLRTPRDWATSV